MIWSIVYLIYVVMKDGEDDFDLQRKLEEESGVCFENVSE
jgi:hypothetical protein